jgi:hypothetical protein
MSGEEECEALGGPDVHPAIARAASAATSGDLDAWLGMSAVIITSW